MKIQDEISAELKTLHINLGTDLKNKEAFSIPERYFHKFPDEMLVVIQAMNASLPEFEDNKINPYTVPEHYFEQLEAEIIHKVSAMEAVVQHARYPWDKTDKKGPFSLPEGYFEQFEQQLLSAVSNKQDTAVAEIATLSPLLAGLKKEQPFAIPQDYFDKVTHKKPLPAAKVVEHPSVRSIKWARWTAAASVLLIFALGGLHFLSPGNSGLRQASFEQSLAKIPDTKIKEWLSNNMDEEDVNNIDINLAGVRNISTHTSLNNFSEKEIKDYLESETW